MKTIIQKFGTWSATTTIELSGNKFIDLTTSKRPSGNLASVIAVRSRENGFVVSAYGDPTSWVIESFNRVTKKAVIDQHDLALTKIDDFVNQMRAKYNEKELA
jgi:hypothetical protein